MQYPVVSLNISGGTTESAIAEGNGVVNISNGQVGRVFTSGTVNISGGTLQGTFQAVSGSVVNVSGSEFSIDGTPLNNLQPGQPFTISDRDVVLSGILADGEPFSLDLVSEFPINGGSVFLPNATLNVTLEAPILLGDVNQDGVVNFQDVGAFITILLRSVFSFLFSGSFLPEADCNQDGVVNFDDIPAFIEILYSI